MASGIRDEAQRQAVLRLYQSNPRPSWREITRQTKASSSVISDVLQEAGLLQKRTKSAPSAPAAPAAEAPAALHQEGNGLDEFLPEHEPESAPKGTKQSAPTGGKQSCPHCGLEWLLEPREKALLECPRCDRELVDGQCGACGARWRLDPGEKQPSSCPTCKVPFA